MRKLIRRFFKFLRRLFGKDDKPQPVAPPSPVTQLQAHWRFTSMSNIRLSWTDPTTREDGSPFDPASELAAINVAMRVQGATTFTPLPPVPAGQELLDIPDLVGGTYEFEVIAEDVNGRVSSVVPLSVDVPIAPPSPVGGLSAAVT